MATLTALTNENFDAIFNQQSFLVVDFWSPTCKPCQAFSGLLETLAARYPSVFFASVNAEEQKDLAKDFDIRSVPTLVIIRDQVMVFHQSGTLPEHAVVDLLQQAERLQPDAQLRKP